MKSKHIILFIVLVLIPVIFILNYFSQPREPNGLGLAVVLENKMYDTEVKIYGHVSDLGELFCSCFTLSSEGESVEVWYDLMTVGPGQEWPAVSVEGINNGDLVIVTGELRSSTGTEPSKTFWAKSIEVVNY